jgi:hypothetical protein
MQRPDTRSSPDMLKCRELKNRLRHRDILRQRNTEPRTCTRHHTALVIIHKKWFQARTRSRFPDFQRDLLQTSASEVRPTSVTAEKTDEAENMREWPKKATSITPHNVGAPR